MDAVALNAEWQRVKDTLQGTDLGRRMQRVMSWIECAAKADNDDAKFIFYWIAFNAAYGRRDRKWWFTGLVERFLDNQYVFHPFWEYHNNDGHDDWEAKFKRRRKEAHQALDRYNTRTILIELFDRLYVLRNQIMHGGATWKGKEGFNRFQVQDGARIMEFLVPHFASLMMSNPRSDWGPLRYLVAD